MTNTHVTIKPSVLYFGTPVVLLSTENADGTMNLAPMSSAWALGDVFVLGLGPGSHTARNLQERPELVINFPAPEQWEAVDALGRLTGADPVPSTKRPGTRYEPDKFGAVGFTQRESEVVRPPRVAECPAHIEARAVRVSPDLTGRFTVAEASVLRVHADERIVIDGTSHIDTGRWSPLIYNFRHYFGLDRRLGKAAHAEY